jgi:hypothetical protein
LNHVRYRQSSIGIAGFGSRVPMLPGYESASAFVKELGKAAMGVPSAILPMVGGALDPITNLLQK